MSVMETSRFTDFIEKQDQQAWNRSLEDLSLFIHPVDRIATRIWFGFWPIELCQALGDPRGGEQMARIMDLEGRWRLDDQIDSSVGFLYGARYWPEVKEAVLRHAGSADHSDDLSLEQEIRRVAGDLASQNKIDPAVLVGITAVAFMVLRQVGVGVLSDAKRKTAAGRLPDLSPDEILRRREKTGEDGWFPFLRGVSRKFRVVWDETTSHGSFVALHGEDLASAAAKDKRGYRAMDYRRPEGPIPVECRIGSCGYCWVGAVSGKDNLSELTPYEGERLHYFGYDRANDPQDPRPPIRLACQARCQGNVTIVIPPWNGELSRRFHLTRDKLGTA